MKDSAHVRPSLYTQSSNLDALQNKTGGVNIWSHLHKDLYFLWAGLCWDFTNYILVKETSEQVWFFVASGRHHHFCKAHSAI